MASIFALLLLAVFASLSVAFFNMTATSLAQSSNLAAANEARLTTESGLAFIAYTLAHCGVSGSLRGQALLNSAAAKIAASLNGTPNLAGAAVTYDGNTITIPSISLDGVRNFSATIVLPAADTLRLAVTGQFVTGTDAAAMTVQRQVTLDFHPQWDQALGYGMCVKGPVQMGMNNTFVGLHQDSDGSIYSAADGIAVACGSGHISGDVSLSNPGASVSLSSVQVDGEIRYGIPPLTMPAIDRTGIKSLATNVMNLASPPGGTYTNIRIPANTNPTFGSDVTIRGVMYVEAPNKIYFNNNCIFTGIMAADDPPAGSPDADNYICFNNGMAFNSVTDLPAGTPHYDDLQKYQGAEILAPGFTMEFKNNMTAVGGIMALKSLIVKNNAQSTFYGSLLIYGDAGLNFKNNDGLSVSLSGSSPPPGFKGYGLPPLQADPDTYTEK